MHDTDSEIALVLCCQFMSLLVIRTPNCVGGAPSADCAERMLADALEPFTKLAPISFLFPFLGLVLLFLALSALYALVWCSSLAVAMHRVAGRDVAGRPMPLDAVSNATLRR